MPNPAGLGALAATLNYIPIIGPIAMFIVLLAVGLISFPTVAAGLLAPLLFAVMTFIEGHFVTPVIIGRRLSLNTLAVFLTLAFWTWLWGPVGAFLSAPLLIVGLVRRSICFLFHQGNSLKRNGFCDGTRLTGRRCRKNQHARACTGAQDVEYRW